MTFMLILILRFAFLIYVEAKAIDHTEDSCGLYLAESSIKNAGWGVFAGKDFGWGDHMGSKGIGIPVLHPEVIQDKGALEGFLWISSFVGGFNEASTVQAILPGIAMLANHHSYLANFFEGGLSYEPLLNRSIHPMVGSSTSYHNLEFIASRAISAGEELFLDSKQQWVDKSQLPRKEDYTRTKSIVDALIGFHEKHPDLSEEQWIDILFRMRTEMMMGESNAAGLLPNTLKSLMKANQTSLANMSLTERSLDWLKENGQCLDNIQEGVSTIPGAGRGAFATRYLPKGTVVSPAPLMQIMDKRTLLSQTKSNCSQQLLWNYCFGHRKSEILLCPTTHVTLINHGAQRANVEIRWGESSSNRFNASVNNRLEELEAMMAHGSDYSLMTSRLSFDFFATKNIKPGDEIFLNYGKEWDDAFSRHVAQWTKPDSANTFIPSNVLNRGNAPLMMSDDPRMIHQGYECRLEPFAIETSHVAHLEEDYFSNPTIKVENWNDQLKMLVKDNKFLVWYPCELLSIDESGDTYKTHVYSKNLPKRKLIRSHRGVPRKAIRYTDRPYHSDQHLAFSFRHYIPIPDSMFPLRWRNDYTSARALNLGIANPGMDSNLKEHARLMEDHEKAVRAVKCGVYFAPSNIPNSGFGTYTAVPLKGHNMVIGTELPAIAFPRPKQSNARWDGNDYIWNARAYDAEYEAGSSVTGSVVLAVNDGALANFHPGLVNELLDGSKWIPVLDRCTDSGAGAFSDYNHYSFKSKHEIGAGEELFVSYGEQWFTSRTIFRDVALAEHYNQANSLLSSIWSLISVDGTEFSEIQGQDMLKLAKSNLVHEHRTKMALRSITSLDDIQHVINRNGTAQTTVEQRSMDWFEKHGHCIDHIYARESTISQAGKGAFSRRLLKKGSIIISAPLLATWGQSMFEIETDGIHQKGLADINNISLFLNYQFSHPDSNVFFFPINQAIVINHNSDRRKGGKRPNAKLDWATWNQKSTYYLARPLEDLENEHYSTMVLDIIATRDIYPDEEVFIDYGEEWENSWNKHVQNYGNPCRSDPLRKTSKVIAFMNNEKFNKIHHAWSDDHFTVCKTRQVIDTDTFLIVAKEDEAIQHSETIGGFTLPVYEEFWSITWDHVGFNLTDTDGPRIPCLIGTSNQQKATFDVVYFLPASMTPNAGKLFRVTNVPESDIDFLPMPYRSDTFHKKSFRHAIKIPDDIFPAHWRGASREHR